MAPKAGCFAGVAEAALAPVVAVPVELAAAPLEPALEGPLEVGLELTAGGVLFTAGVSWLEREAVE